MAFAVENIKYVDSINYDGSDIIKWQVQSIKQQGNTSQLEFNSTLLPVIKCSKEALGSFS